MKKSTAITLCFLSLTTLLNITPALAKPSPDQILQMMQDGNERYASDRPTRPNRDLVRRAQAGVENQGDHAYATVITCSDSRVPVELIFDAGVMDIFVIRVAGNVCDVDEVGSIEYGLSHVNTPVMVVLGHTQCGAVTAVTNAVEGHGHPLERNIPPLVDNIIPAVKRAQALHPGKTGHALVPFGVEENVWQGIEDLFLASPSTRDLVQAGKVKVIGAIYDVATGKVKWLPESQVSQILASVGANPNRAINALAESNHGTANATDGHGATGQEHAAVVIEAEDVTLVSAGQLAAWDQARHQKIDVPDINLTQETGGLSSIVKMIAILIALCVLGALLAKFAKIGQMGVAAKLYSSFAAVSMLAVITAISGNYFLGTVNEASHLEATTIGMAAMAGDLGELQFEYVVYGIEDKDHGEEILLQHEAQESRFLDRVADLNTQDLDENTAVAVVNMETEAKHYVATFKELTNKFTEVVTTQEELAELEEAMDEQLAHLLHTHEANLINQKAAGASSGELTAQFSLIETLAACEVFVLRITNEQSRFLLDKQVSHIAVMENELGQLRGGLKAVRSMIASNTADNNERTAELAELALVSSEIDEWQQGIAVLIEDELLVEADLIKSTEELKRMQASAMAIAAAAEISADAAKDEASRISVIQGILAFVIGGFLAFFITRGITKPLNIVIAGLNSGAEQVASASVQVASAGQQLAEGSSEQASSLEETAASLEMMSSAAKGNATNTEQASQRSQEVKTQAERGQGAMSGLNDAMEKIMHSTAETAKIIKTIDEIAFQTNLLALNAAVEAARAGDAGKGFAVVAEEVRNLAQRSAEAAKGTADLIEGSQENSDLGVKATGEVHAILEEIVGGIIEVSDLVEDVSATAGGQTRSITEINSAVGQLDSLTQANAASAEESASAAEEMSAQANEMSQLVQDLMQVVSGGGSAGYRRKAPNSHSPVIPQKQHQATQTGQSFAPAEKGRQVDEVFHLDEDSLIEL